MVTVAELSAKLNVKDGGANKRFKIFGLTLSDVQSGFALVARAAQIAGKAISAFTTDIAAQGDEVAKTAKNLGIGVQAVQELGFAAKIAGQDFKQVQTAIQRMQKGLNDARQRGTGPFADGLKQLGLDVENFAGLEPDQQFIELAEALSKVEDSTTKAALAQDFFGRGGKTLIPLIDEGRAGIEALAAEFQALGGGFTDDGAAGAEAFQDAMLRMGTVIDSVKIALGEELLPVIQQYVEQLQGWIGENKELIKQRLIGFIRDTVSVVRELVPLVVNLVGGIGDFVKSLGGAERAVQLLIGSLVAMKVATLAGIGPYGLLAAAGFAAGTVIANAFFGVEESMKRAADARRDLTATIEEGARIERDIIKARKDADDDATARRKRIESSNAKNTTGFAPELLVGGGAFGDTQSLDAVNLNAKIRNRIQSAAKLTGKSVESRLRRGGTDAADAKARGAAAAAAVERQLTGKIPEAREAASEAFLAGDDSSDAIASVLTTKGTRSKRGGGRRRRSSATEGSVAAPAIGDSFVDQFTSEAIQQRVSEGKVTPTILVTVTNNNITQTNDFSIPISGIPVDTAQTVERKIRSVVDEMMESSIRRAVQDLESPVS